ncbi:TPA: HlyD family secretion protein [Pasteurella multocida]|nr:HlyD family efflux transporter periplasmic adaptor subunit [Pasteurella multocida]HEA3289179.1 HlyD family efflux transporter periplasmic adaptor subunit [Pasteurella multocida]
MKKWLFMLPLIVIGCGVYWTHYHHDNQHTDIVSSNGRLEFLRLDVASLYAGRVEQVLVKEGDYVNKDTLLATLSSDTVKTQVDTAFARKQQAQQAVKRVQAQLSAQQQQLNTAQLDVDNAHKLRKNQLISSSEFEKRLALRDAAQANLHALDIAVQEAQSSVAQADAQLRQAHAILADLQIKAPQAGRVVYKLVEVGNVIAAGQKVVSLLDLNEASMYLFFPAPIVNQIPLQSEARLVFDGLEAVFPATVSYVSSDAQFTPKFVETTTEREKLMFKVKLQIPSDIAQKYADYLKSGMTGNGYIRLSSSTEWPAELQLHLPD